MQFDLQLSVLNVSVISYVFINNVFVNNLYRKADFSEYISFFLVSTAELLNSILL